jgi:hypothetical protein
MYTINVTDIENVTAVHIHSGKVGENGPIVVILFKEHNPTTAAAAAAATIITGEVLLSEGNIPAANLEGPMAGKPLSTLTSAMNNEQTYVKCSYTAKSRSRNSRTNIEQNKCNSDHIIIIDIYTSLDKFLFK